VAARVVDRYAFKDFPHSSHRLLADWVGRAPCRVLDLGTASGFLGRLLAGRGHTVVGVESDPEAAAAARPHYAALHLGDLERLAPLPEAPFDVVIAGDVLEHLADPPAALDRAVAQLAPGGRLLVSVPNVAFVQVRFALLLGRFEYAPRGILDRTHLRFFTRRSLLALLRGAGLTVTRRRGVPPPLPLVLPAAARWPLRLALESAALAALAWPTLFAFQLVAEARR
jgi:2-polyprenyl-3-methyl-5-hydroxy-6-metoxy-1,4-benzoquinol methylase